MDRDFAGTKMMRAKRVCNCSLLDENKLFLRMEVYFGG